MGKIKVKTGMYKVKYGDDICIAMVRIVEEFNETYLVKWGRVISSSIYLRPVGELVDKSRIFNVTEKEVSKFKLWCFNYWGSDL